LSRSNNVLIGGGGVAKLTDFGLSVIMAGAANTISASEAGSHPHTERWAAPEILDGADVDEKADVYSFAMLLFEIFSRAVRFAVPLVPDMIMMRRGLPCTIAAPAEGGALLHLGRVQPPLAGTHHVCCLCTCTLLVPSDTRKHIGRQTIGSLFWHL